MQKPASAGFFVPIAEAEKQPMEKSNAIYGHIGYQNDMA